MEWGGNDNSLLWILFASRGRICIIYLLKPTMIHRSLMPLFNDMMTIQHQIRSRLSPLTNAKLDGRGALRQSFRRILHRRSIRMLIMQKKESSVITKCCEKSFEANISLSTSAAPRCGNGSGLPFHVDTMLYAACRMPLILCQ